MVQYFYWHKQKSQLIESWEEGWNSGFVLENGENTS